MAKDLKTQYKEVVAPKLKKDLGLKNINAVPKVKKITINVGMGSIIQSQGKDTSHIVENLAKISGQKPIITKTRKAISNFKVRENMPVGLVVTLRGQRMYDFLNKLINITLPRVRDFRGLSAKAFDGNGNYSLGLTEHVVFPEINPDDVLHLHGVQVTITTSATNDEDAKALLTAFNFPFKK